MPKQQLMPLPSITAFDLFCGAGGLTNGLLQAGIKVSGGVDTASHCKTAYEANNTGAKFIHLDVENFQGHDLASLWNGAKFRLLAGCAPCQPFSTYNQGKKWAADVRYPLMAQFSRLVKETMPEFVTMENVPNVIQKPVFEDFVNLLHQLEYSTRYTIVSAAQYGVPQSRNRLVLLASRLSETAPMLPAPGNLSVVRDKISNLRPLKAGEMDQFDPLHRSPKLSALNLKRIRASKPGGSWHDWPKEIRCACHKRDSGAGYTPVYGRMHWDKPAPTLTTQCYNYGSGRFGHPAQDRAISLREAALIQGFPENYKFESHPAALPTRDIAKMIGNAVPVGLGKAIGTAFRDHLTELIHARRI